MILQELFKNIMIEFFSSRSTPKDNKNHELNGLGMVLMI